jgi:ribulose-phosphate 3-epimerase
MQSKSTLPCQLLSATVSLKKMTEKFIIAPSVLSADLTNLGHAIQEVESAGAQWIHVDVMDGHYVPNISMGPVLVKACRQATELPVDVHLMVEKPFKFLQSFADAGANSLTVHPEADVHIYRTLNAIAELGLRTGVSLNPGTPAGVIKELIPLLDLVMVMTVNPGDYGQPFIEDMINKVREVRMLLDEAGSTARVQVDGGISAVTAPLAFAAGADVFVAAKAIFQHPDGIRRGVEALRASLLSA